MVHLPPDEIWEESLGELVRKHHVSYLIKPLVPSEPTDPVSRIIRQEPWTTAKVWSGESTDPERNWAYGDDPAPDRVHAQVVSDPVFGSAVELGIDRAVHGETAGIRLFPVTSGRWDLFEPGVLYDISSPLRTITPLSADEGNGTSGLWLSYGLQIKDAVPGAQATFATNVKPDGSLWVQFPHGAREEIKKIILPMDGSPSEMRMEMKLSSGTDGLINLFIDDELAWKCRGRTGNPTNGGGNVSLVVYGNSLKAPFIARFGPFLAKTA